VSALGNYIRQIEGLQDALTKRNARIAELEKLLDVYIEIGERRAEERIIKLLDAHIGVGHCDFCNYDLEGCEVAGLIVLIKKEK
jgi:hypothetical protein